MPEIYRSRTKRESALLNTVMLYACVITSILTGVALAEYDLGERVFATQLLLGGGAFALANLAIYVRFTYHVRGRNDRRQVSPAPRQPVPNKPKRPKVDTNAVADRLASGDYTGAELRELIASGQVRFGKR